MLQHPPNDQLTTDSRQTLDIGASRKWALSGSTDWTPASIVLSVAKEATALYFGALLSRAGAVDLARLRFEEVSDDIPATVPPLPDEPQALDFAAP